MAMASTPMKNGDLLDANPIGLTVKEMLLRIDGRMDVFDSRLTKLEHWHVKDDGRRESVAGLKVWIAWAIAIANGLLAIVVVASNMLGAHPPTPVP